MRRMLLFAVAMMTASFALADDKPVKLTFAKTDVGKLPKGWKADHTGAGEGSVWKVMADASTPSKSGAALAQQAESPDAYFNICVAEETRFKDGSIEVAFKAIKGKDDQGGGIVWRYKDGDNYYICRMNPLEDNFRVYKVEGGKRTQFRSAMVPGDEAWHTLRVTMAGPKITCQLDGKTLLEVDDATFPDAGRIGLWSKADAQSYFDDLTVAE
jgi:hypothetical protein